MRMRGIPDYSDHMLLDEFIKAVKEGCFIDWDGSGYYATENEMSDKPAIPSGIAKGIVDHTFTHVVWFNK